MIRHRALQDLKIRPEEFENLPMWERVMITASIVVEHNLDGENGEVQGWWQNRLPLILS